MLSRSLAVVLALVASFPLSALADARADFETGRNLFSNGEYGRASDVFRGLLDEPYDAKAPDAKKRREVIQAARPLYAACLVALGRVADADRVILEELRDDPFYEPPAGQFPEPVVQRFIAVSSEYSEELDALRQRILRERQDAMAKEQREREREQQRLAEVLRRASEEVVVTRRSRVAALAPFGIGQFQNGNVGLGIFFATAEAAATGAAFGTMLAAHHYAAVDCRVEDCETAKGQFEAARLGNWISVGLASALFVAGAIEAESSLVPEERTTRKRSTSSLAVTPTFSWSSRSVGVGLATEF